MWLQTQKIEKKSSQSWDTRELLALDHNDHRGAFEDYLNNKSSHVKDKQGFLRSWISPSAEDFILECGSSSGKTCVDLAQHYGCRCLGVDFDQRAVNISTEMRDKHFPQLKGLCAFSVGDLTKMDFERSISRILMIDFTEHVPDPVLCAMLDNMKKQLPHALLFIYTPCRSHVFEILKQKNFILKNPSGHINVKTMKELAHFLENNGCKILDAVWRPSHIPVFNFFELVLGRLSWIGPLFQRRIAIVASFA